MVLMGSNWFVFLMYDKTSDVERNYRFNIEVRTPEDLAILRTIEDGEDEVFDDFVSDLEGEYGVHDVSFNPDAEFYGFTSYEVDPLKEDELIEKWRKFFIDRGLEVFAYEVNKNA